MLDNELPPLGGGMGTANIELLKQFANIPDFEIDLITSALDGKYENEKFADNICIYKVPVWNRNIHHSSNRELIVYSLLSLLKSIQLQRTKKYDFCFAWSTLPAGAVALTLYQLKRLPYMVWVSGPDIPGFEQRYENIYPLLLPLIKKVWLNAAPLIAKCLEEKEMITSIDHSLKVIVIPNGADISGFKPQESKSNQRLLKLICVARLIERKGQHHLIQALAKLKSEGIDVTVDLVGTGDSLAGYQALTQKLDLQDRVNFAGYIPRQEIWQWYQRADIFVLPSYNEGMSLAALEAMSCGLPLLLTRTGGTADLVEDGVNGFTFDWGDVNAIVELVSHLNNNIFLLKMMGKASRLRAENYAWPSIAKRYYELFSASTEGINSPRHAVGYSSQQLD